ncbi:MULTISPECIES: putative quinol monooxygenase [unclassified Mycobacterium]|uniref:putative quinol monooxygenase n=1 Tax=unclassified Mycobacterium TaxID=2642494 RepID=UPI00055D9FA2|nr:MULTISPECIES: putative quinol monooxygenase [unclassified Mycobacterium]SEB20744.1 Quinol monooxygenase YgiN [Mycobacterium sp. 283mftsu]
MSQVTNIAFIRAVNGRSDELGRRLLDMVQPSREEVGCINYDVHRSDIDPDLWCVYENWRSADDLDAHFELPHTQDFLAALPTLVDGEFELHRLSMTSTPAAPRT